MCLICSRCRDGEAELTNEELAIAIQNGESGSVSALWEQVKNFVARQANRLVFSLNGRCGVTVDDLINTGFIAMCEACKTYSEDKGSFLNWLNYYLKTAFAEACGYRTSRRDMLDMAESLDHPLDVSDARSETFGDIVPDPIDPFEAVDNALYNKGLHERLEAIIDTLPHEGAEIIRGKYWRNETTKELAARMKRTEKQIRAKCWCCESQLRRAARHTWPGRQLQEYINMNTPWYLQVSVSQFNATHTSAVERIVIRREELERRECRQSQ